MKIPFFNSKKTSILTFEKLTELLLENDFKKLKIEKEKGFSGVWELLNVGPFEKGNEKYYQTLEKLTGITKENYNNKIWELISNEK